MGVVRIAFTPSVQEAQERLGVHRDGPDFGSEVVDSRLSAFLETAQSLYLGTASADGRPYIQHRGGPRGFVKVLDEKTLAFADYRGNRQYVSIGDLAENDRAFIFLMDYQDRTRLKLWGRAEVVEDDPALLAKVADPGYPADKQRVILFHLEVYDGNCPKGIPRYYTEEEVQALRNRIEELESKVS